MIATPISLGMQGLVERGWLQSDIPRIVELLIRCGEEYNPDHDWRASEAYYKRWLANTFNDPWHYFHVVRSGRVIIAMAGLCRSSKADYDGHVHSVYVDPAYRQRGLSRLCTERVVEFARRYGLQALEMAITINPIAKGLYERMGFAVVESENLMALSL